MAGFRETTAEETLRFNVEAGLLAQACQDVLKKLGKVSQVVPQTGLISGEIKIGKIINTARILLTISNQNDGCDMKIRISHTEGIFALHGAQKALMKFADALATDVRLRDKTQSVW